MEMIKRKASKDDGRYIIFYEFKGDKSDRDNNENSKHKKDSKGERG